MENDEFEWHDPKAEANEERHKVSFVAATTVFRDPGAIEAQDTRSDYGEVRFNRVGSAGGFLLHVTYTMRGRRIRIISARKASPHEREAYRRQASS